MKAITVTQLVALVDETLDAFDGVVVEGEVDEYQLSGGKWVRFALKDESSTVRCFMPVWYLKTEIENGMKVLATGRPKLTQKWGFSFNLTSVVPSGEGSLKRAFELLKKKLHEEGLFDADRKRPIPVYPQHVVLITSREAAAYTDFLKVLQARQGGLTVSFIHTQVQGEKAAAQIIGALETANTELAGVDVIVLVRGGGSLEDLQSFNDEQVVRAIAGSRYPTIVGVGHERDITLADLAADVRASTPSNAAELLVKSRDLLEYEILLLRERLRDTVFEQLKQRRATIKQIMLILHGELRTMKQRLTQLQRVLMSLSPLGVLKRGYSITITQSGKVLRKAGEVNGGDKIISRLSFGEINSTVTGRK
ncbi:MAG: exodeoxyribonuclease VII large subunit [Candidatus Andersenbacteria bacterium RIFCSPHIGHO2_12_FULL_46_9]|nr:MAG: exodeoxyribonuclease VII large subunit [Parcubacteria group bacterium GW2011_GWA2_45_14]OGY34765.1 MAG: exodeoxyribonuclease VII large subunit [Candidatus Andersenbacteria bacterium RIFCSPHIGHO2_02_FULL_46_16]OGY35903.1 MAG: exodeoxyribonuclease VII large subunit [Candidatus Andersenbacteria bacterium RIFCSPHIGHO2_12_FULL_46_9]OGY38119.1 MAG: exodeoxyribonuclease VII large subunit [Candidatus Andersenbacteria bacterium RIFCSPLOWO2_02_FULL_46_11]OGY39427.1 MAG: exodeoxyribonuclease VII l